MSSSLAFALSALASAATTWALVHVARRVGWVDDPSAAPGRKRQPGPVPPVGGAAILVGWIVARLASDAPLEGWSSLACAPGAALDERWTWTALGAAFATGLVDDLLGRGLSPRAKLIGQALAGVAFFLACAPCLGGGPIAFVGCVALALIAQNLVNTWDNADGAAAGYGLLGLWGSASVAAGACAGFLPFNLARARPTAFSTDGGRSAPAAYLGDSGSHLIGMGLLLAPASWPVLVPCALDLVRLVWVRHQSGDPPWRGDRRHLAHRLQAAGLGPMGVVLVLVLLVLPALAATWIPGLSDDQRGPALALGIGVTVALYTLLVRWTLEPPPR